MGLSTSKMIGISDIYNLLMVVHKDVEMLKKKESEFGIEEISLSKAARLMNCGKERILGYINEGLLPARKVSWDGPKGKFAYKIRLTALKKLQLELEETKAEENTYVKNEKVETAEEIFARIMEGQKNPVRQNGIQNFDKNKVIIMCIKTSKTISEISAKKARNLNRIQDLISKVVQGDIPHNRKSKILGNLAQEMAENFPTTSQEAIEMGEYQSKFGDN